MKHAMLAVLLMASLTDSPAQETAQANQEASRLPGSYSPFFVLEIQRTLQSMPIAIKYLGDGMCAEVWARGPNIRFECGKPQLSMESDGCVRGTFQDGRLLTRQETVRYAATYRETCLLERVSETMCVDHTNEKRLIPCKRED